jgi:hypothetical protein
MSAMRVSHLLRGNRQGLPDIVPVAACFALNHAACLRTSKQHVCVQTKMHKTTREKQRTLTMRHAQFAALRVIAFMILDRPDPRSS